MGGILRPGIGSLPPGTERYLVKGEGSIFLELDAGIGFTVALKSENEDFIGRAALEQRKEHPRRRLVGLELEGSEPAEYGDCVHVDRPRMGVVTLPFYDPERKRIGA